MKTKILLTGASGFVGENFCHKYADKYDITGIYHKNPVSVSKINAIQADLTDSETIRKLIHKIKPDAVIHLMAVSDPNFCELNPELSNKINVETTELLALQCADHKIRFVFASTDLVYDGKSAPYSESDKADPINIYGKQKLLAEEKVLEISTDNVICRLPLMYGPGFNTGRGLIEPMLKNLKEGKIINLFTDEYRSPVSAESASDGMILAMEKGSGIYNLGGNKSMSRYALGEAICEAFGCNNKLLNSVLQDDIKMAAKRPGNVSMWNKKAKALGWQPASLEEDLAKYKFLLHGL